MYPNMQWRRCTHPLGRHPLGRHPPGRHPPRQTPSPSRRPLKQAVRILLECILVLNYFQNLLFPSLHFVIRHHVFVATCNVSHKIHRILTSINLSSTAVISLSFVISICDDTEQQRSYLTAHCYQPMSNLLDAQALHPAL